MPHKTKVKIEQNKLTKNTDIVAPAPHMPLRRSNILRGEKSKSKTPIPITIRCASTPTPALSNAKSKQFAPENKYSTLCIYRFLLIELWFFGKQSPPLFNRSYQ